MTALQSILKEAKALKKAYPKRYAKWTDYVKQASAIYASKHKGKSPVGKKHAVKKKAAKKKAVKKVGVIKKKAIKKTATKRKPTEKAVLKSIKKAVSVQKAHMSGVSHHAIDRIKSAMSHLSHYEMAVKKYMALPLKERKMYSSNIKKLRHLVKETKTHITQLKKSI